MTTEGVVFVGVGTQYAAEAVYSARRLKTVMPDTPVCLVTDCTVDDDAVDEVVDADTDASGVDLKIRNMAKSPYDRTLFLDTDAYVAADCSAAFDLLDTHDIAAAHKPDYMPRWQTDVPIPESYPEFNTGVIAFRTEQFESFVDDWLRYNEDTSLPHDQPAFRTALFHADLRTAVLPSNYNLRYTCMGSVSGEAKVFHGRVDGRPYGSEKFTEYVERVVSQINRTDVPRTFVPIRNGVSVDADTRRRYLEHSETHPTRAALARLASSVEHNGVFGTLKRVAKVGVAQLRG